MISFKEGSNAAFGQTSLYRALCSDEFAASPLMIERRSCLVNVRHVREVENNVVKECHEYVLWRVVRYHGSFSL